MCTMTLTCRRLFVCVGAFRSTLLAVTEEVQHVMDVRCQDAKIQPHAPAEAFKIYRKTAKQVTERETWSG